MSVDIYTAAEGDADWTAAAALAAALGQTNWLGYSAAWHVSNHLLVARAAAETAEVVGFLRFVVQPIGPDMDCPAVVVDGKELREAKILAFGVAEGWRRQGTGRALQQAAIAQARTLGCYQVRSHSSGQSHANHRLKLALGFALHPIVRGDDVHGCYFLLPLHAAGDSAGNSAEVIAGA